MSEVVSGILGKFSYPVPWVFAAAITTGAGWLLASPAAGRLSLGPHFAGLNAVTAGLVFAGAVTAVGFAMAAAARPLYQVLEGYSLWPWWLRTWRLRVHRSRKWRLQDDLAAAARSRADDTALRERLLGARLGSYPVDDHEMAPTLLGNALRTIETYGRDRYRLNSQTLWHELHTVTVKALLDEVTGSRVSTDFFVALVYLMPAYGLVGAALTISERLGPGQYTDWPLIVVGGFAMSIGPMGCYRLAVLTTTNTLTAVRAMVNLGRPKLADELGLSLPTNIEDEREMWASLSEFVGTAYHSDRALRLDAYRRPAKEPPVFRAPRPDLSSTRPAFELELRPRQRPQVSESPSMKRPETRESSESLMRLFALIIWGFAGFLVLVLIALQVLPLFIHHR